MKNFGSKRIWKKLETKECERNWKQNNMKEIENKIIWKILERKECERNWKPKNMKEIRNKRIWKDLKPKEYEILQISGHSCPKWETFELIINFSIV
jgi:hypothetical protein